ncbi:MAG: hypothetical protein IJS88_02750 [Alphaproteobacteria bacterium]|nr:hypothetical protein [Alphaproteobacteria bacterium]
MNKKERIDYIYELVQRYGETDNIKYETAKEQAERYGDEPNVSPETIYFPIYAPHYSFRTEDEMGHGCIYGLAYDPVSKTKLICSHSNEFGEGYYTPPKERAHWSRQERYGYEHIREGKSFRKLDVRSFGNSKSLLGDVIYSAIMDKKICDTENPNLDKDIKSLVKVIKEECVAKSSLKDNKEFITECEEAAKYAAKSTFDRYGRKGSAFAEICKSVADMISKKYNGKLKLPRPIVLTNRPDTALAESHRAWMLYCDSIRTSGKSLDLYLGRSSDLVTSMGDYGIDFINSLNDLVGGPKFEIGRGIFKRSINMENIENISKEDVLNRLFDAHGGKEMPFRAKLHGISGYISDKLIREKNGGYTVEYHIIDPNAMHNPALHEKITVKDIEKYGGDLLQKAKQYNEEFNDEEGRMPRFQVALQDLMPNVYEEVVLKSKLDVRSLDEVLTYYNTKEKVSNKLQELKEKAHTDNIEDIPHTKTQVLRELAKDNLGKPKRSDADKQIIKSALDKVTKNTRS